MLVLLELAAGTTVAAFAVDLIARVGRGYIGTTAAICAAVMGVEVVIAANVPAGAQLLAGPLAAGALSSLVHWSIGLMAALVAYTAFCAVGTDPARRVVGLATIAVAAVALAQAVVAFGPALGGSLATVAAFAPAALLAGSTLAGMLLGHWYLVVPSLSFRPLRRSIDIVFIAVAAQAVVLGIVLAVASPMEREAMLRSHYGVVFWLLVVGAGLVFTTCVAVLTRYFARIRANQPATAMLYVLIISAVMGVVPAHLLFFVSGIPV